MIQITKEIKEAFMTKNGALLAFQTAQLYFIQMGFLTVSSVNLKNGSIELTVHFELPEYPTIPLGYKYSAREITSHYYYSDIYRERQYVRCLRLTFKY